MCWAPRARQSTFLMWSASTTPSMGNPGGRGVSQGEPLARLVIGQASANPTLRLYRRALRIRAGRCPPCSCPVRGSKSSHTKSPFSGLRSPGIHQASLPRGEPQSVSGCTSRGHALQQVIEPVANFRLGFEQHALFRLDQLDFLAFPELRVPGELRRQQTARLLAHFWIVVVMGDTMAKPFGPSILSHVWPAPPSSLPRFAWNLQRARSSNQQYVTELSPASDSSPPLIVRAFAGPEPDACYALRIQPSAPRPACCPRCATCPGGRGRLTNSRPAVRSAA